MQLFVRREPTTNDKLLRFAAGVRALEHRLYLDPLCYKPYVFPEYYGETRCALEKYARKEGLSLIFLPDYEDEGRDPRANIKGKIRGWLPAELAAYIHFRRDRFASSNTAAMSLARARENNSLEKPKIYGGSQFYPQEYIAADEIETQRGTTGRFLYDYEKAGVKLVDHARKISRSLEGDYFYVDEHQDNKLIPAVFKLPTSGAVRKGIARYAYGYLEEGSGEKCAFIASDILELAKPTLKDEKNLRDWEEGEWKSWYADELIPLAKRAYAFTEKVAEERYYAEQAYQKGRDAGAYDSDIKNVRRETLKLIAETKAKYGDRREAMESIRAEIEEAVRDIGRYRDAIHDLKREACNDEEFNQGRSEYFD